MNGRAAFGARLRRERERRGLSLDEIAAQSKVSASHFAALERGDLSRWPAGIFGVGFIRSYAEAVGLDAAPTVQEFVSVRGEVDGKPAAASASQPGPAPLPVPLVSPAPHDEAPLRLTLAPDSSLARAAADRLSPKVSRILVALAHPAILAAVVVPVGVLWSWWAYWPTLAIAALASQVATEILGRSLTTYLLPRHLHVTRTPPMVAATAREPRRAPDSRPAQTYRRARRADRKRPQA